MSKAQDPGFGKFVPGFDFLQGLAQGRQTAAMPSWVAPTLDPQELDKRIEELRTVQFWLDQNAIALKATIQALEVQKMTLATLKGMNLDLGGMAQAFSYPAAASQAPPAAGPGGAQAAAESSKKGAPAAAPAPDPMQLWGSLTQQFQQIAAGALQEVASKAASAPMPAAKSNAESSATATPAPRRPARKTGARKR